MNENQNSKKSSKIRNIILFATLGIIVIVLFFLFSPSTKYKKANDLLNNGKYDEAISIYTEIKDYKDSTDKITLCNYEKARVLFEEGKFKDAKTILSQIVSYEDAENELRKCNHMILYNYIKENGEPYKDVISINNEDTGLLFQVRESDPTIKIWYEYDVDSSATMSTIFSIPLNEQAIDISYFLELHRSGLSAEGDGEFYPHLYDGNLKNASDEAPDGKISRYSQSLGVNIWIDDVEYSRYIDLEFDYGGLEELAALQYYCDFKYLLTTLQEHIEALNCGVQISDFGVDITNK